MKSLHKSLDQNEQGMWYRHDEAALHVTNATGKPVLLAIEQRPPMPKDHPHKLPPLQHLMIELASEKCPAMGENPKLHVTVAPGETVKIDLDQRLTANLCNRTDDMAHVKAVKADGIIQWTLVPDAASLS